jgi:hypothetical protein
METGFAASARYAAFDYRRPARKPMIDESG